jgi:hypothetical protein
VLLSEELAVGAVNDDELVTLLASSFPRGEWHGGYTTVYRSETGDVAITVTYRRNRIVRIEGGPGLTDEARVKLRDVVATLAAPHATIVWRDVFFGHIPVDGFWRHRDEWQIVPAPPQAPRSDVLIAEHPFIVELRVPWFPRGGTLDAVIRGRRAWELQLILNLVLRGRITRFSVRAPDHTWAYVREGDSGFRSEWVQPGYFIPGWTYQSPDFTPTDSLQPVPEVSDDIYRTRRGIGPDDVFEIPEVLSPLLEASRAITPEARDRFFRACYWYERSGAAWNLSVSLGHIAAVNAVETIMPKGVEERCPTCGLNRAPGITRRFHDFVERFAPMVPKQDRKRVYELRSSLVHDGYLVDIDRPGPWGALVPPSLEQLDTYQVARTIARDAIIGWLLHQAPLPRD